MKELEINTDTLPKDYEFVKFTTKGAQEHSGQFIEGDNLFVINSKKWFGSWEVYAWEPLKIEWEFESWAEKAVHEANIKGVDEQGNKYEAIGIIGVDSEIDEVKDIIAHVHDWKSESNSVMGVSRTCRTCGEFNG